MKQTEKLGSLNIDTTLYKTRISTKFENRKAYAAQDPKMIVSFIPGTVLDIMVKPGDKVKKGDILMVLDAMKMQNNLKSAIKGKIKKILVKKGDKVSKGTMLILLA